ncbi:hypothetical protein B1748_19860 [Paenibacillus sp. MY03]|uniref:S-layer homology domain-containing protein n=1 Tax=Paenibacillus sp. MY03 TaxID=302980 RepID=UPI000B3C7057|nr:S-layer homology domain-containing protein [Paenibacillus sp. MY03]OUS74979.1 hypothetical protein B1748_19860 [Paenibacillus sp. MY03]
MKKSKRWSMLVLAFMIGLLTLIVPAGTEVQAESTSTHSFYISQQGSDSNDGSVTAPFATLEAARDAIRAIKANGGLPAGGITVFLREGHYSISESFELTGQDSGSATAPIEYRSYPGEEAVLVGGIRLDGSQFTAVGNGSIRDRLQPAVREHVLEYDLTPHGALNYGSHMQVGFGLTEPPGSGQYVHHNPSSELFVDAEPFRLARWPDTGFVLIGEADPLTTSTSFEYLDPRPESWADLTDVWMYGYKRWDWADGNLRLDGINTITKRILSDQITAFAEVKKGQRYYYYNVLEELDVPGEWYLDRNANKLYAYLPPTGTPSEKDMYLSLLNEPMVTMDGASHITFKGLSFEASRDIGVVVEGGSSVVLDNNIFRNLGNIALSIDGGQDHIVIDNQIYNTGYGAIYLNGGDRATLTPSNFNVVNNEIYNFSRIQATYSPGVELRGVGHRFAHNEIYDGPHMAIWIHGNNHVIEYNEIYDVLKTTSDAGAMYIGSDWAEQGTVIRYNYLHNLYGVAGIGQIGVYLDDMASGSLVYGNVIDRAQTGMLVGGGRNNMVANNIVMEGKYSIRMDDRGVTWAWGACAPNGMLHNKLQQLPINTDPWASRYTNLTTLWGDTPCLPKYNTLQDNVYQLNEELIIDPNVSTYGYIHSNWVTEEDPGFVNRSGKDFSLAQDAKVFDKLPRFNHIPFEQIGLREDPWTYLESSPLASIELIASAYMLVHDAVQPWVMADNTSGVLMDIFGSVSFVSSDTSVARVHPTNGTVTAVAPGKVTITATIERGGVTRTDSAEIEVLAAGLDRMEVQVAPHLLRVGHLAQLNVTGVLTNNEQTNMDVAMMTYTSNNNGVAEINLDGIIKPKQEGIVTFTAHANWFGVVRSASITMTVYPEGHLEAPWTLVNYGDTDGYVVQNNGAFTIRTNGANVWGEADAFTYAYRNVDLNDIEGDFEISTKVNSLVNTHPDAAAGIMIRDKDSANAKQVNLRVLHDGVLRFVFREEEGGESDYAFPANPIPLPTELKLTKSGNVFEAFYKQNNEWVSFAEAEVEMDNMVLAGIMTIAHSDANTYTTSVQSNVQMTMPNKPPVAPQNLAGVAGNTSVSLSWSPVAGADSYTLYKYQGASAPLDTQQWEVVQASLTEASYQVTGLTNGNAYSFAVTAVGPGGESLFSTSATATPLAPTTPTNPTPPPSTPTPTTSPTPTPTPTATPTPTDPSDGDGDSSGNSEPEFSDMDGHWSQQIVKKAASLKLIQGYPDGKFRPDQGVTRAQFAVMLANALKLNTTVTAPAFTDSEQIPGWAREAVAGAAAAGLINGYEDGSFHANAIVTRAQMAVMLQRALRIEAATGDAERFADHGDIPVWARPAVEALRASGLIEGRGGNRFAPNAETSRAEAAAMLLAMLEFKNE